MRRPQSLREVAAIAAADANWFGHAIDEFLDTFYLAHPDKAHQQHLLEAPPATVGNDFMEAWIGAVGEHLARRWSLSVPSWTRRPEHYRLSLPRFVPDSAALRSRLLVESPPAFRSRLLFTFAEPLRRARFPSEAVAVRAG